MNKKNNLDFKNTLKDYIVFLKKKRKYFSKDRFVHENNIEKLNNWSGSNFKNTLKWYYDVKKNNKAKVKSVHLEKMKKWKYDKKKGIIKHVSGGFFKLEGKRILNAGREVNKWDQPFITQIGYKGGIIGLVRANIGNIPHYLIDAKYEPGNYNNIQLSPSLQATYSNLRRLHLGQKNKVIKKYFLKNFITIRKMWVTEDGGRLYKKRNLHWIIQYNGEVNVPGKTFRWLTLWEINKFIQLKSFVSPHLRSILSLI